MTDSWNDKIFMTREQMRDYDSIAMEKYGLMGLVLMENAGRGAAEEIARMATSGCKVVVVSGPGNNGGDGYVTARSLMNFGFDVTACVAVSRERIKGDALINYKALEKAGAHIVDISDEGAQELLGEKISNADIVVDALLGTGLNRPLKGHLLEIIKVINSSSAPVVSLDIPSGMDADTGNTWGEATKASMTVTFGHLKRGMVVYPGASYTGEVKVVSIGVPSKVTAEAGFEGTLVDKQEVLRLLPKRKQDCHKGTQGHLAVVAGSMGKSGAAVMAGKAAMRAGSGLVTIATTNNARATIEPRCLEVMVETLIEKPDAALTDKVMNQINKLVEGKTAIALGPGLTTAPGISALVIRFLQSLEIPAVIDADGLNILAADPSGAGRITAPMVFTPHPGEMARLMGKTTAQVQADRIGITREAALWHKVAVVLKGANTVIASPEGEVFINPTGNPGMASGGMGDVLTGIIGSYLAQGLEPVAAAILGTYIHGLTADRCIENTGFAGLIASDLLDNLPLLTGELERESPEFSI